jgi:hypothetical protein
MPAKQVASFLADALEATPAEAQKLARLSGGSIGVALGLQDEERDGGRSEALALVRALLDGRPVARLAVAHGYRSFGARGGFSRVLAEARALLRDLLAVVSGAAPADPDAIAGLATDRELDPRQLVLALDSIDDARELADRNVNPQLIVVNLLRRSSVLHGEPPVRQAGRGGGP